QQGPKCKLSQGAQASRAAAGGAGSTCQSAAAWTQQSRARTRNQARRQGPPRPRPPPDRNGRRAMKSPVVKRSIVIAGHKTSVSLEDAFWRGLKEIASGRHMTLSDLVAAIDSERQHGNLSSAIRLFVLDFYRNQLSDHNEGRDGTRGVLIARAASTA